MMKIILATPRDDTVLGTVGGYCEKALKKLGHDVSVFDFRPSPYAKGGFLSFARSAVRSALPHVPSISNMSAVRSAIDRRLNKALLDLAGTYKPDIFLALLGENIYPETVLSMKATGVVTANWLFDTLASPHRIEFMKKIAPSYDHIILIDSLDVLKSVVLQANHIESIPLGCDEDVHGRMDLSDTEKKLYSCDVAFVGTVTPEREKILESLADLDLAIWGRWQGIRARLKKNFRGSDIYGIGAVKIYNAAKIIIDIHSRFPSSKDIYNVTPRVFEVPASGGFLITNDVPQLRELYEVGDEIVVYHDVKDLREKVLYYLSNEDERKAIALKGYQKAHKDYLYTKRLDTLMKYLV